MNCFTYTNGETLPGFSLNGENQKTCAFTLNIPYDWDADELINRLKNYSQADILLYSCVQICEGNSVSSVFPENCVMLASGDIFSLVNYDASCLEVLAEADRIVYIMFNNSELYDTESGKYIRNNDGTLEIIDQSKRVKAIEDTDDHIIML
jgi:hypothetical protein